MTDETDLSEEEFSRWVKAADAVKLFPEKPAFGVQRSIAEYLKAGLLRSAAKHAIYRGKARRVLAELAPITWAGWANECDSDFWGMSNTRVPIDTVEGAMPGYDHNLFDVRLDPEGLREMGAVFQAEAVAGPGGSPATPPRHPGGAPAKPYWEALMFEMLRQYAEGKLTPVRQADVERAMLDWLSSQGHEASERSVRTRAKQVWEAIKTEGQ